MKQAAIVALMIGSWTQIGQASDNNQTPENLALGIVIDTSWSCRNDLPEFRTLVRQSLSTLGTGNYVEVITAHQGKPHVRFAQALKPDISQEQKAIADILKKVRCYFLQEASVSRALAMMQKRLDAVCSKQGYDRALIVVLSDGHLTSSDRDHVLWLAKGYKKRNWPLYITGDTKTSKGILIAASQGELNWAQLSEASPALWLRNLRAQEDKPTPSTAPITDPNRPAPPKTLEGSKKAASTDATIEPIIKSASDSAAAQTGSRRVELHLVPVDQEDKALSISQPQQPITVEPEFKSDSEPNTPTPQTEAEEKAKTSPATSQKPTRWPDWWWALLGLVFPGLLVTWLVLRSLRQARTFEQTKKSKLRSTQTSRTGTLIVKHNGRSHRLGSVGMFRSATVGSGAKSSIRIIDRGLADRHISITRKGDQLILKNLAKASVKVAGSDIKPGSQHRLLPPCSIQLNDKVTLQVSIQQPVAARPENRSVSHEQPKALQV